jgi:glycosyltransferase involved in cell wall biosynthesis
MAQAYQAAKRVFCVSRHNLDLLENQLGVSLPRAEVVWNPFNVPTDPPPPWPSEESCLRMACVARLEPTAKGQDVLLKVLSQDQWRKRPVEINFYGSGPCEQSLRSLVNRLELKNVHFRGQVADVAAIWKENHILVLPSRAEGLPLALVEAMWCGRPAIVTNSGGNAEVCIDGETGFVAAAPAVSLLAETMEQAWERRHEWQSMGQAARAHAAKVIPRDPINKFCQQLLKCASKS